MTVVENIGVLIYDKAPNEEIGSDIEEEEGLCPHIEEDSSYTKV